MKPQNKYLSLFQRPIATISTFIIKQGTFSVRWILLSRILLLIVLFLVVSQFITYQKVRSTWIETARQNLTESASIKTKTIENSLKAIKSNLVSVSQDYVLKSEDSLNDRTLIEQLNKSFSSGVDCVQTSEIATNKVVASSCGATAIQTFSANLWPQKQQQLTINNLVETSYLLPDLASENNRSANESQISLVLSVPVYAIAPEDNQFQLRYALSVRWKFPLENNTNSTIVIDEAGTILAHPNGEKVGHNIREEKDASQLEAVIKNALRGDRQNVIQVSGSDRLLIGYATTANPISTDKNRRWVVLAFAPLKDTLSSLEEIQQVLLRTIACLIVIGIIVAINLIHTLARPLEKLIDYAISLNNTEFLNLQETPKIMRIKEFNKLAEALAKIADKLKLLSKKVEETLKEANIYGQSKIQFLRKTSKVLRTNLNCVICSIQLVLDDLCENREEEIEYLEQCCDCSVKLLVVVEECFNLLQSEQLKTLKETHIPGEPRTDLLSRTCDALRTHLNGTIGSLQLVLNNYCDNREEEIEYLQQSFDCSLKFLGVLEEFFNLLQEEKAV